jgi:hypothetical protein
MGSCRDSERFAKKEKLLEEMGSCRDGERLPKKRNCWRKWVHAEMEKDCPKRETVGGNGFMQRWRKICKKQTVGGNGFMQRLRKICEKEIAGGNGFMHGFIFLGFMC